MYQSPTYSSTFPPTHQSHTCPFTTHFSICSTHNHSRTSLCTKCLATEKLGTVPVHTRLWLGPYTQSSTTGHLIIIQWQFREHCRSTFNVLKLRAEMPTWLVAWKQISRNLGSKTIALMLRLGPGKDHLDSCLGSELCSSVTCSFRPFPGSLLLYVQNR